LATGVAVTRLIDCSETQCTTGMRPAWPLGGSLRLALNNPIAIGLEVRGDWLAFAEDAPFTATALVFLRVRATQ
jgi:hypothetical protein